MSTLAGRLSLVAEKRGFLVGATLATQILVVAAILFFSGINATHGPVQLMLSPERMAEIHGDSDPGSYLKAALDLVAHGRITQEFAWTYNLWPPGMVWLEALLIRLSPFPFGVSFALVTAIVWGVALTFVVYPFVLRKCALFVIALFELLILATSPFQSWMFDDGLFYADGLAVGMLLIALALTVARTGSGGPLRWYFRDGILVGIALAAAVYFRASNNLVPYVYLGVALVIAVVIGTRALRRKRSPGLTPHLVLTGIAGLVVIVLMAPYAAFVHHKFDRIQFVKTQELIYTNSWRLNDDPNPPQWLKDAGGPLGCDLDVRTCKRFAEQRVKGPEPEQQEIRDALFAAIATHPGRWVVNRVSLVTRQWFGDEFSSYTRAETDYHHGDANYSGSYNFNPTAGFAYLGLLMAALVAAIRLAARGLWSLLVVPLAAVALLAPFAIVHVEVRYLIPLKMLGLLAPMLILLLRDTPRAGAAGLGLREHSDAHEDREDASDVDQRQPLAE